MEVRFLSGVLVGGGAEDVGTLGDEGEALIADDGHVGAVSAAQDVGGEDVGGRALGNDATVDADDLRQVGGDGVNLVGCHHDGHALVVKLVKEVHDVVPGLDVDASSWFVQEKEPRVANEGSGEEYALLLSPGELSYVPVGEMGNAEALHDHPSVAVLLGRVPGEEGLAHGGTHEDDFLHSDGEVPVSGLKLGNVTNGRPSRADGGAIEQDSTGEESDGTKDDTEQSGLTGTAGSEQSDEITGHDSQVHSGHDGLPIVAARDIIKGHDGSAGGWGMRARMKQRVSYCGYMAVEGPSNTRDESRLWKGETSPPRAPIMVIMFRVIRPR